MPELRGLVLAAGLGTRLAPVTDYLPKPLLPVAGRRLLDRALEALLDAGCTTIAVNAHHRADQIADHLRSHPQRHRLHLSLEPRILGTAGALHGARDVLAGADHLLVFNGDVLCPLPLNLLLAEHRASGALATLVLVDRPEINTVRLGVGGTIRDLAGRLAVEPCAGDRALTFTGIACYRADILDHVPAGPSDLVSVLTGIIAREPAAVRGLVHAGDWDDLGTLPRYLDVHRRLLGPGFVSLGRAARVPASAVLDECVVLPGGWVPEGTTLHRAVVGAGWTVSADASADPALAWVAAAGFQEPAALEWFGGHGSDRRFARLRARERRAVLMVAPPEDADHERTVRIASFLYDGGLGAPAVLAHDPRHHGILFEDLGDDSLGRLVAAEPDRAADLYDRVLDRLADLQTFGTESRHRCPLAWDRAFDREHLRWETDYFRRRFLVERMGVAPELAATLDDEFADLATACLAQPRTLVHRDFQSQNILLKDGVVRLVDVQGMRWGPVAYDVVSLLFDPYVELPAELRDRLLDTYRDRLTARGGLAIAAADWSAMTVAAGLQRIMQALGAYAFLGGVKGRSGFLRYVPAALARLESLVERAGAGHEGPAAPPAMSTLRSIVAAIA
jgi:NDP-sugar pyrophosphorylase family protein